jgi:MSHA biogenesis protein MshL
MLAVCCVVLHASASSAQPPQRPMPVLPLTQLDECARSADLDTRTFSLTFAQAVPVNDLLLLLVRGTSLSIVPDPAISGSFIGELKNVTVRQTLDLILRPLGLDYSFDGNAIRVFRREPETRIFDLNYLGAQRAGLVAVAGGEASSTSATTATKGDLFDDLTNGVRTVLSERATFNVDRKAGLLQVTDFPERLDRVSLYLDAVQDRVHRQVQIEGRVIDVEPNDNKAAGVDWTAIAARLSGAAAGTPPSRRAVSGMRVTDVARLLELIAEQGKVSVLATPRLRTLNNEPSIVRTDTLTFAVTPQIASDSVLTLSVTPMIKAPAIESDLIARVADGETLVVSGFTRDREIRERKNVGISGGWFGRGTVVTHKRIETIILLTPTILGGAAAP